MRGLLLKLAQLMAPKLPTCFFCWEGGGGGGAQLMADAVGFLNAMGLA